MRPRIPWLLRSSGWWAGELEVEALGRDELVQELRTSAIAPCATHNRQVAQANLEGLM